MPVLNVRTTAIDDPGSLIEWTHPMRPAVFLRNGDGIIGFGERARYQHSGGNRVADIARWWRDISSAALVHDEVGLPGTGLVGLGSFAFSDTSTEASVLTIPSVIVGRRDGRSWITTVDGGMPVSSQRLGPQPRDQLGPGSFTPLEPGAHTPDGYRASIEAALREIAAGRVSKVVLARDLVGSIPAMSDRRWVITRLAEAYPDTFTFAVDGLLGSSPETLVRVRDGEMTARVLAGTAGRLADPTDDAAVASTLGASRKNRSEHELAVRGVLDSLAPHATGVMNTEPFALQLPNLWHLATDVRGSLCDGRTALDLVAALHPTAAVAGVPTDAALALIAELEPRDRGRYAGPVGWVDGTGDGEWAIALRCASIDEEGVVTAWAGAGIVAGSDPEKELAETDLKFRPMVDALER
ncbi:isochorismate synthase MenF [Leifsonia sp. AK011]|uniref:isochorismate synthase n=1 Tax=Leifsonia sp. AK011 TaxID=2723075 RepID=UPI0035B69F57